MELKLTETEFGNTVLELVVKSLVHQRASTVTLIEMLAKSDSEADEAIAMLNNQYEIENKKIMESIFIRRGNFGLDDVK